MSLTMAKTHGHRDKHNFHINKECKVARKQWIRKYRARIRKCISNERWEDIPRLRKTSGWETY